MTITVRRNAYRKRGDLLTKLETNYSKEKIILEIWTNGSIHPEKAISEGVQKILDILIPLQKTYSYKKTKLTLKPRILNKAVWYSSFHNEDNQRVSTNSRKIFNIGKTTNFKTRLNIIYRPWFNSIQFKASQNYLLIKQKKTLKSTNLINIDKKFESNQSIVNQLKFFDISYLNLPTKLYVCLKRANINTIQDLLLYSRNELLLIKNLKRKSVKKIEILLAKQNFKLRSEM